jgi:UPF0176 protein
MLDKGFENVYHLKGGILKYLEKIPESESLWSGECFVFDQRAAVSTGLIEGNYELCRSCRTPITNDDKKNIKYEDGVTCIYCYDTLSEKKKLSARERNYQIKLADEKNLKHLGQNKPQTKDMKKKCYIDNIIENMIENNVQNCIENNV